LNARKYSANKATVLTNRAINERDAGIASLIIGSWAAGHESSFVY
jgi:hypothetical protein